MNSKRKEGRKKERKKERKERKCRTKERLQREQMMIQHEFLTSVLGCKYFSWRYLSRKATCSNDKRF